MTKHTHTTYETTMPWLVWTFGLTHDRWWPPHTSTRITGRSRIRFTCAVCGTSVVRSLRIPRIGAVPMPESGRHPAREEFMRDHAHPDRGHPMSWALPFLNPAVHTGGVDVELLAARLEADINHPDINQLEERTDG